MKYLFSIVAALYSLLSNIAYAGYYGDLNLGANFVSTSKQLTYPLGNNALTQSRFTSAYNNFHGQLALGYDYSLRQQWGVALEANADLFTGQSVYNVSNWFFTTPAKATEQFKYGWGLFLLPRYQLNDQAQLFIGPGVTQSQFKINSNSAPTGGNLGFTGQASQWLTGWGFKAGTSLALTSSFDLLLTYQFSNYQTMTRTGMEPLSGSVLKATYRPTVNTVMLGIKYLFGRETHSTIISK